MFNSEIWTIERLSGICFILGFAVMSLGIAMFLSRGGLQGGDGSALERGALMAAVVVTVVGVALLDGPLGETAGRALSRVGLTLYILGAAALLVAEATALSQGERSVYALIVIYVVLALLAQAAVGGALLQTGIVPAWVGWTTIVWNLGFLVVLPIVTSGDMYYPVLHGLMPLVIGIYLLL